MSKLHKCVLMITYRDIQIFFISIFCYSVTNFNSTANESNRSCIWLAFFGLLRTPAVVFFISPHTCTCIKAILQHLPHLCKKRNMSVSVQAYVKIYIRYAAFYRSLFPTAMFRQPLHVPNVCHCWLIVTMILVISFSTSNRSVFSWCVWSRQSNVADHSYPCHTCISCKVTYQM